MNKLLTLYIITITISYGMCEYYDFLDYECSYFEDIKKYSCKDINTGDESKKCSFYNNKCVNTYKSCEDYKDNIQKDICESITIENYPDKKCIFENNKCIEKERTCSEFKTGKEAISNCHSLHPNDANKICIFKNNKCEEQYKKCEDYKDNIQKDICESIQPFNENDEIDVSQKCVYDNETCIQKDRYCTEYNYDWGVYRYICEQLYPLNSSKICALVNNKCIEQFAECEDYNGKEKNICESIEPSNIKNKCVLLGDKCTSKKKASCSDYKSGSNEELCV